MCARRVKGGSGLINLARTAALAGNLHSCESALALLAVFACALFAYDLQPVRGALFATEARRRQGFAALPALLLLGRTVLPAAADTLRGRRACQAAASTAAHILGLQCKPSGLQLTMTLLADLLLVRRCMLVLVQPVEIPVVTSRRSRAARRHHNQHLTCMRCKGACTQPKATGMAAYNCSAHARGCQLKLTSELGCVLQHNVAEIGSLHPCAHRLGGLASCRRSCWQA